MTSHELAFSELRGLESSARSYPDVFPAVFVEAYANYLIDMEGCPYLDLLTGAGVQILGHNDPDVVAALALVKNPFISSLDLSTIHKLEFLRTLQSVLPVEWRNDTKFHFCGPTGSDAIEAALKLARISTGKAGVIAFMGSYHGMSQGALAVSSNKGLRSAGLRFPGSVTFGYFPRSIGGLGPLSEVQAAVDYSLAHLETMLTDDHSGLEQPGAILIELVQGEGGNNVAPFQFVTKLAALCKRFNLLLIVDEIQSGMGRTGKFWAFEHYDIRPDIICMSKGIGGGFPIALLAYRKDLDVWNPGDHIGTFRGQDYAFVAGAATIKKIRDSDLLLRAKEISKRIRLGVECCASRHPEILELRGLGIYLGLELANSAVAKFVQSYLFKHKILMECGGRNGTVLRFLSALSITDTEINRVLSTLDSAFTAYRFSNMGCSLPKSHPNTESLPLEKGLNKTLHLAEANLS